MTTTLPLPTAASQQLVPVVQAAVTTPGPQFSARALLSQGKRDEVKAWALKALEDSNFGVTFFIEMIKGFDVQQTPGLDAMLENMKMRDGGVVSQGVQGATRKMREVNGRLPKVDQRFVEKVAQGKAKAREVVNWVRAISEEIREALQQFQTVLAVMQKDIDILQRQYDLVIEAVVRDGQLAEEADGRTDKLLYLCAGMEDLKDLLTDRLEALKLAVDSGERERLEGISPLLIKRLGSLPAYIHMGNMNERRFLGQRNANAIVALGLGDFLEMGIPQWKTDVVLQLDALQAEIAQLALQTGIDFMNKQAVDSAEAYEQMIAQSSQLLGQMALRVETLNRMADAIVTSGETLMKALGDAAAANRKARQEVERGRGELHEAENKLSAQLVEIMRAA